MYPIGQLLHNNKSLTEINISYLNLSTILLVYVDIEVENTGKSKN